MAIVSRTTITDPGSRHWRRRCARAPANVAYADVGQAVIHRWTSALILVVIFSGLARKLMPSLDTIIFFLPDLILVVLLSLCLTRTIHPAARNLLNALGMLTALLIPCVLATGINDPVLALFGLKQYALFPIVAVAVCTAYVPNQHHRLTTLFRWIAISVAITTAIAVLQNHLPAGHWLNRSVRGDDLSGFSAGGYLRVSSTFSFVGQYCYYLNALCYALPTYFFLQRFSNARNAATIIIPLVALFLVGTFITGSRGSVIGNAAILCVGAVLSALCGGRKALPRMLVVFVAGGILLVGLQLQYPRFFAAYQARVSGTTEESHSAEIRKRVEGGLFNWTEGTANAPPSIFGYGLGVMSNGSGKLSAYAERWRSAGFWTETDQSTTFFEGGWYLMLVWYGFRFWIIYQCLTMVLKLRRLGFQIAASFAWGFVLVVGSTGTLAIQPPLAVWWWLAVGVIHCFGAVDRTVQLSRARTGVIQPNARHL
jgi:hypothetical protein